MDDHAHRRVIIAGGSISGLVLALCLQAADIDFLVLERGEIAPQLGASVGMYPHGNNVLQQLGVYDDMAALACPLIQGTSWDDHGNMFGDSQIYDIMTQRTGYPVIFIQRRQYLQVLYDHIHDKNKVLPQKEVVSFDETDDGVIVHTKDGGSYKGTILVGADGVHSAVRELMAEKAQMQGDLVSSAAFGSTDNGKHGFGVSYNTIFAVSRSNSNECPTPPGSVFYSHAKGHSSIIASGAPGVIFWFFFVKTASAREKKAPRYSQAEVDATIDQYGGMKMCDKYTLGDAWKARIAGNMLALEEGVVDKWSRGRAVLVGDAVHKMTINAGLGANTAIEGIVTLVNRLHLVLSPHSSNRTRLTTEVCDEIFASYHDKHLIRAKMIAKFSAGATRLEAWENWAYKSVSRYLLPTLGDNFKFGRLKPILLDAPTLSYLPRDQSKPINLQGVSDKSHSKFPFTTVAVAAAVASAVLSWIAKPGQSIRLASLVKTLRDNTGF